MEKNLIKLNKPLIYMMVGLPRSGKSTFVDLNLKEMLPIVSADRLRLLIYGQKFWAPGEKLVWTIRSIIIKSLLEQGIDIVIDETNTTKERRREIIDLAKEYNYSVKAVIIETPKDICINRAKMEGDNNIIPVIERMAEQFEEVDLDEVDYIYRYK